MTEARKLRVVPRARGDTTPLDPAIAAALRRAGMDPTKFTVAPDEPGALPGVPAPGTRLAHSFRFGSIGGAFSAMERVLDERTSARISKAVDGWLVVFETEPSAGTDDAAEQERIAQVVIGLGGEDRGLMKETINVNVREGPR